MVYIYHTDILKCRQKIKQHTITVDSQVKKKPTDNFQNEVLRVHSFQQQWQLSKNGLIINRKKYVKLLSFSTRWRQLDDAGIGCTVGVQAPSVPALYTRSLPALCQWSVRKSAGNPAVVLGMEVRAVSIRAAWAQWAVLLALTVPAVCKVRNCYRLLHSGHGAVLPSMYKWMRGRFVYVKN